MACSDAGKIEDHLTCTLCHQMFKDPVVLQSCGHNFCRVCLQRKWKSEGMEDRDKKCPICQEICPADTYASNIALLKLVERANEPENKEAVRQMMMAPQDISEQLKCGLCHKMFQDPVILQTCGHNFCHECLQKGPTSADQGDILCPTCKQNCPKNGYVHNVVLGNLVKRINRPVNQEEQGQQEGQAKDQVHECEDHKERISLFCSTDQTLCCLVCRDSAQHLSHKLMPLAEASGLIQVNLSLNIQKQLILLNKVMNMNTAQETQITEHKAQKQQLSEHITSEFEKLRKLLNDEEREHRQRLDTVYDPTLKEMEENRKTLIKKQNNLEKNLEECQKKLVDSHIGILQDIREFIPQHCVTKQIEDNVTVINDKPHAGLFKGPFQYYTWKNMLSVVHPAASPLSLDAETAHRNLLLSNDFTAVSYNSSFFRRVPDSPKRFSHFPVALTREGFSDGCHYWEVDVDGKNEWYIGLAKETVNRKQTQDASIRDGNWAICHNNQVGIALLTEPIVPLGIRISPKRVGVYLDYQGGQVSFYDVQRMSHLYSFSATFTGKLYPYVGTASTEEVSMNIVHIRL